MAGVQLPTGGKATGGRKRGVWGPGPRAPSWAVLMSRPPAGLGDSYTAFSHSRAEVPTAAPKAMALHGLDRVP